MTTFLDDNGYARNDKGDYWSGAGYWIPKEQWDRLRRKHDELGIPESVESNSEAPIKDRAHGNVIFEIVAAQLDERHIAIKLACMVCGNEWQPSGQCVLEQASSLASATPLVVPPSPLLVCPRCTENAGPEAVV